MHIALRYMLLFLCLTGASFAYAQAPKIPTTETHLPASTTMSVLRVPNADMNDYAVQLLHKALVKGARGRPIPVFEKSVHMEQARMFHELSEGKFIDIHWAGTDETREKSLRTIYIPVDRGLLGMRQFIIRRDMIDAFDKITSVDDLKKFKACQGLGWPDTQILHAAGLPVTEIPNFEAAFKQVIARHCDYFPRAFFEAESEMEARKLTYPELIHYKSITLYYPLPIYFFVNRNNEELAQWIESGLEQMISDGDFLRYMQEHPNTRKIFNPSKIPPPKGMRRFEIPNPMLSKNTDFKNQRYWFRPSDIDLSAF